MFGGIDQRDGIFWIYNTYFEFIVFKYSQIYYKYLQFNKYTEFAKVFHFAIYGTPSLFYQYLYDIAT